MDGRPKKMSVIHKKVCFYGREGGLTTIGKMAVF